MRNKNAVTVLVLLIAAASAVATSFGIFSYEGDGQYEYESIRGEKVIIYGIGIYQHMSADVATQGIAQDYITLFAGILLLLISLYFSGKDSLRGLFLLTGTLGYFLVTYLFYLAMGMYNELFLVYAFLTGTSFFAFLLTASSLKTYILTTKFKSGKLIKNAGIFLIINASLITILWFGVVLPPLFDGTFYPAELQHYTTLIVQGFDLGLLLPAAFVVGYLAVRGNTFGYLFTPVYMIFLSLLMTALVSKLSFMAKEGVNVIPAIFIIPVIAIAAIIYSVIIIKDIKQS